MFFIGRNMVIRTFAREHGATGWRLLRNPPTVLIHPNGSSIGLRLMDAEPIAGMPGRPPIDRWESVGIALRDACYAAKFATSGREVRDVISLAVATVLPGWALSAIMSSAVSRGSHHGGGLPERK
jgi:hypothetical protein